MASSRPQTDHRNRKFRARSRNRLLPRKEIGEHPNGRDGLRGDGRQRRPRHAPTEGEEEDRRQHDVQQHADEHGQHGDLRVALAADHGVQAEAHDLEDRAQHDDAHVVPGVGQDGGVGPEQIQQGIQRGQADERRYDRGDQQQDRGVAKRLFRFGFAFFAEADRNQGGGAEADQHAQGHQEQHEGKGDGQARDGVLVDRPAHEDPVDGDVEGLGHQADNGRSGEFQQQRGDLLLAQPLGSIHDGGRVGVLRKWGTEGLRLGFTKGDSPFRRENWDSPAAPTPILSRFGESGGCHCGASHHDGGCGCRFRRFCRVREQCA